MLFRSDDGRPVLLLDPSGLAAKANFRADEAEADQRRAQPEKRESLETAPLLVFKALDGASRAIRLAVVERIEDVPAKAVRETGGRLRVTLEDRILPLAGCEAVEGIEKLRILRLSDGAAELAYGFAEVIDIMPLTGIIRPAAVPGEIAGVALIGGEQVELVDPYWLFEQAGATPPPESRPVCAIPAGDPWMENMLKPLVESLGYEVVTARENVHADIVIASDDAPSPPAPPGAQLLRLSATPEAAGAKSGAIYRYDRAALLDALGGKTGKSNHG